MLYFDPARMEILDPKKTSDVDFNATLVYRYNDAEVQFIEDIITRHGLSVKSQLIMNQLLYSGLRLLGPVIQKFFGRPYDFQLETVTEEDVEGGKLMKIFFTSREA